MAKKKNKRTKKSEKDYRQERNSQLAKDGRAGENKKRIYYAT